ncbi:MAG: thioesterase family protein [Candidatus Neomarinimicrobiota bacterium]
MKKQDKKSKDFRRVDFDYFVTIPARWKDLDGLRHGHAVFLTYIESARLKYLEHLGFAMNRWDSEKSTILAALQVDYINQAGYPNDFEIGNRIIRVGYTSFDQFAAIFRKDLEEPLVVGRFTLVTFNYTTQKTLSVPAMIRSVLRPL